MEMRNLTEKEIKEMTDQKILFDIAKNSDDYSHRYAAIRTLTDQEALADIVKSDGNYAIRAAAVEQMTNQEFLAYIAKNDEDEYVRQAAVERLDDQNILIEIAKNDKDNMVRLEATKRITDQMVLAYIAINEEDYDYICETAVEQLNDQAMLADVARNSCWCDIRIAAAEKLSDQAISQEVYTDIAKNANDTHNQFSNRSIRMEAAEKLNDQNVAQEVYADIAKNCDDWEVCEIAVKKLTDQKLLVDVVNNGNDGEARLTALSQMTDQMLLADIVINNEVFHKYNPGCNCGFCQHEGVYFRLSAIRKISNQAALVHVVKNSKYGDVRFIAVTKLSKDETLDYIAKNDADNIVRKAAVERLTNHVLHNDEKKNSEVFAVKQQNEIIQFAGIAWRVLDVVDGRALILSDKVLTRENYHTRGENVTWEKSVLRKYLNGSFYQDTFNAKEQSMIIETKNQNLGNSLFGMSGGDDTLDKVFLLSLEEVVRYFGNSGQIYYGRYDGSRYINDEYNMNRKAEIEFLDYYKRLYGNQYRSIASTWWLRSPFSCDTAAMVYENGGINVGGNAAFLSEGVRPALWLKMK
jgi:hypothetical protein